MQITSKKILIYILGMFILAAGLTLNTKVTLGVSPILSVPYAVSEIFSLNFGNVVFFWYCLFIVLELLIHYFIVKEKDRSVYLSDVLQILVSLVFTRIMNLYGVLIPTFENLESPFLSSLIFRLLMLCLALVLTAIGAALTLNMHLVPNPGDGIVAAMAQALHKKVGTSKNIVDISCVAFTVCFSCLLARKIVGVGIGTLIAMLGVGRIINFINAHFDFSRF